MRCAASSLSVFVAALALVVALPATWAATHLSSTDGFVELTDQVSADPAVKERLADLLAERVIATTGLPDAAAARLSDTVTAAAEQALADDDFHAAWTQMVRASHERFLAEGGPLVLDFAPLASLVADRVQVIDAPSSLPIAVTKDPPPAVVQVLQDAPTVAVIAGLVCAAAALLALVMAPRRSVAMATLGVAAIAAAVIVALLGRLGGAVWSQAVEGGSDGTMGRLATATSDLMAESLHAWLLATAIAGAVLFVVGLVAAAVTRER